MREMNQEHNRKILTKNRKGIDEKIKKCIVSAKFGPLRIQPV